MQIARTHLIVAAVFFCVFGASYTFLQLRGHLAPQPAEEIEFAIPLRPTQNVPRPATAQATNVSAPSSAPEAINEQEFTAIEPSAILPENELPPVASVALPANDPPPPPPTRAAPRIAPPPPAQSRDTVIATAQTSKVLSPPATESASVRGGVATPQILNTPRSPPAAPKVSPPALAARVPAAPVIPVRSPPVPVAKPAKLVAAGGPQKPLLAPAAIEPTGVVDRPAATPALAPLPADGSDDPPVAVPVRAPPPPSAAATVPAAPASSPALAPMPDDAEEPQ